MAGTAIAPRRSSAMAEHSIFRRFLHDFARELEQDIDRFTDAVSRDRRGKVRLLAYAGYRNGSEARVRGRIVRYAESLDPGDSMWRRMRAMMAIYNSHELADVRVRCQGYGQTLETVSDEEGYFAFTLPLDQPLSPRTTWESVTLSVIGREAQTDEAKVPVIAPGIDDHWGVISDIDDTIIETGPTNFIKNWRRVLVEQPGERLAVPGAASLYGTIAGNHRAPVRPFFYVSSSPWNLYGFLTEFMELNGIPHGPMFLKDIGIDAEKFVKTGHGTHKLGAIRTVLDFYPGHRFLLIGDNGQKDVEIYAEAVKTFPERVGAVFIRDVSGTCKHGANADRLAEIGRAGVRTFCGAGFDEAVAVLETLGFERPTEVAKAVSQKEGEASPAAAPAS